MLAFQKWLVIKPQFPLGIILFGQIFLLNSKFRFIALMRCHLGNENKKYVNEIVKVS